MGEKKKKRGKKEKEKREKKKENGEKEIRSGLERGKNDKPKACTVSWM